MNVFTIMISEDSVGGLLHIAGGLLAWRHRSTPMKSEQSDEGTRCWTEKSGRRKRQSGEGKEIVGKGWTQRGCIMRLLGLEWTGCTAITTITCTAIMMIATDVASFHKKKRVTRVLGFDSGSDRRMSGLCLSFDDDTRRT